jgi:hypothetical protein
MVIGESGRAADLNVNAIRQKKQTNMRAAGSDETVKLVPPHRPSLDQALQFIREDECVEVTPDAVRLRKLELDAGKREKSARARKHALTRHPHLSHSAPHALLGWARGCRNWQCGRGVPHRGAAWTRRYGACL